MKEFVQSIAPDKLTPFAQHPFQLREDAAMDELTESVRVYGVLSPLLEGLQRNLHRSFRRSKSEETLVSAKIV